ncbi:hypothetical protein PTSG_06199 [Salpingoeca rosetta]|uniref:BAR domain-containing protein n=1 Tax=Salpingoeca rosetta (strain ATCC 50818 / BSB-021) TaxID=946362 RepID=F2UC82_SALR5|nr:uncharacterized protein PTSG_06199 [Salpingoeca rosetta]EGD74189.1 hypothetical protein PTSG_06199 [Salpingoeca rosetta]|eukprot:XP_004993089.1 hypothetical protein PTSG_06199 [Salpingoeca rosetta]
MDKIASRFARAKQYTGEKFGRAEKTEYDEDFTALANKTDAMKTQTEKMLKATSAYLQPNPSRRFEASVYARLKRPSRAHINELEALGNSFLEAADAVGTDTQYGAALQRAGEAEVSVGARFTELTRDVQSQFVEPLKQFVQSDLKRAAAERRALNSLRLDLDAAKSRVKKASPEKQQQAEAELMTKQTVFDDKYESVKLILENTDKKNEEHASRLLSLIKSQQRYFEEAAKELADLASAFEQDMGIAQATPPSTSADPNMAPLDDTSLDSEPPVGMTAKALANRNAESEEELTITADEVLLVFPNDASVPEDWIMAERGGKRGRVPKDCLELN